MAKNYEWIDYYGDNHIMIDSKSIWVDEVLSIAGKQTIVFKTISGLEVPLQVWELKIYE